MTYGCDDDFLASVDAALSSADEARYIREEAAVREYRFESEAALVSHHLALVEAQRKAMTIGGDLAPMDGDVDMLDAGGGGGGGGGGYGLGGPPSKKARRPAGYILDDLTELPDGE